MLDTVRCVHAICLHKHVLPIMLPMPFQIVGCQCIYEAIHEEIHSMTTALVKICVCEHVELYLLSTQLER